MCIRDSSWSTTFTGSVTARVRAEGCTGPSGWTESFFEIASTSSEVTKPTIPTTFERAKTRRITFSSTATGTVGDRWTIYIDGVEYTYFTQLGDTNAQIGAALRNLINAATGVADVVTASGSDPMTLTAVSYTHLTLPTIYSV